MSEVLTQEEINALLAQFSSPEVEKGRNTEPVDAGGHYRVYDFKRPDRFARDQLRTLHMLHEPFARFVGTAMSAHLRTPVKTTLADVSQRIYDEYLSTLRAPSVMYICSSQAFDGKFIIEISTYVVFAMIDRLMGGNGKTKARIRELTEIEETLARGLVVRVLRCMHDAWESIASLNPVIDQYESNPQFAQIVAPNDTVALLTFEMKMGEISGTMSVCIPHSTMQPVMQRLSAQQWYAESRKSKAGQSADTIKARLEQVRVPVIANLGHAEITVKDFLSLDIGDVIVLEQQSSSELSVVVGNNPKFRAIPGVLRGQLAVQITDVVPKE